MSDNYFQDRANKERKPVYVGPDNLDGKSHWVYPEAVEVAHQPVNKRPCPGMEPPLHCVMDIGHEGSCVSGDAPSRVAPKEHR